MVTFTDRLLVHLADPANLTGFLAGADLGGFLTADFQRRLNTGFWQIQQVTAGAATVRELELPYWQRLRVLGREEEQGSTPKRTTVDHSIYGFETARWIDISLDVDTTWTVDQFPGTVDITPTAPVRLNNTASLLSVLRVDAANHPLDRAGAPVTTVTVDGQGRLEAGQDMLSLDPNGGVLRGPDGRARDQVLLELFPRPEVPGLGVPLGDDGQPLADLRVDSSGTFTDLAGAPARNDPRTGLPLDGSGQPVRPARPAVPGGDGADYRFRLSVPVRTDTLTLNLVTRLQLAVAGAPDLMTDLRGLVAIRRMLEPRTDYLTNLDDLDGKAPQAFGLVYEQNAFDGSGLDSASIRQLGARIGVLVHFFAIP
ncbi:hypothetical protein [Kribbella sp. NBC_00359]|uniref:hypothetical protein n=1 Tax=Kribbella sp. NBC_00359 TaxID=2975966 RepID=UPI002E1BF572